MSRRTGESRNPPSGVSRTGGHIPHPAQNQAVFQRLLSDVRSGDPHRYIDALGQITQFCSERRAYYELAKPEIANILHAAVQGYEGWLSSVNPNFGSIASSIHHFARTLLPFLSEFNNVPQLHGILNQCFRYLFNRPDSVFVPAYREIAGLSSTSPMFMTRPTLVPLNPPASIQDLSKQIPVPNSVGQSSTSIPATALPGHVGSIISRVGSAGDALRLTHHPHDDSATLHPNRGSPNASKDTSVVLEMSWEDWEALENEDGGVLQPDTTVEAAIAKPVPNEPQLAERTDRGERPVTLVFQSSSPELRTGSSATGKDAPAVQPTSPDRPATVMDVTQSSDPSVDIEVDLGNKELDSTQTQTIKTEQAETSTDMEMVTIPPVLRPIIQTREHETDPMEILQMEIVDVEHSKASRFPSKDVILRLPVSQERQDGGKGLGGENSEVRLPGTLMDGPTPRREESEMGLDQTSILEEGRSQVPNRASTVETPQTEPQISSSTALPGIFAPENLKSAGEKSMGLTDLKYDAKAFRQLLIPVVAEILPDVDIEHLHGQAVSQDLADVASMGPAILAELRMMQSGKSTGHFPGVSAVSPTQPAPSNDQESTSSASLYSPQVMLPSPSWSPHDVERSLLQSDPGSSPRTTPGGLPSLTSVSHEQHSLRDRQSTVSVGLHSPDRGGGGPPGGLQPGTAPVELRSATPQPVVPRSVVRVLCALEGSDKPKSHSAAFELSQEHAICVERWSKRHLSFIPTEEHLSVTLRCFSKSHLNEPTKLPEDKWPSHDSLFLTLNPENDPYYLPLTSLYLISQPICISPLCKAGSNSVRLLQLLDHSDLVFVVQLEKPSSSEIQRYKDLSTPLGMLA
ncbi:uncharacterized protein EI90DRAFT_3035549 [Cantharellus anzutake]|uniref:uncharacterized protein n=1 Tax=Cantharellus anzutake TaxID=1750568 RepID=UPI0019081A56|nr:uncharacterized protein EI90DRAFT_3035549 [Cantharellus anzutake]KAF8340440.1 hypothetical protein EI90DRAFT_3035549 [Cantharellus anzutake]